MRPLEHPDQSPYDRVMAKRRRAWWRELILALLVVIIAVGVGVYRRENGGWPAARDWTLNDRTGHDRAAPGTARELAPL